MNPCQPTPSPGTCQEDFRWARSQATALLDLARQSNPDSLPEFAAQHGVPVSTFYHWMQRRQQLPVSDPARDFFESPAGLDILRRITLAAHLSFEQTGAVGLRPLISFFQHSGLAPFLACSFGTHQGLACALQDLIIEYGQHQRRHLAPTMPRRDISLCEDETFHRCRPCLVAMEPVSGFLLVEEYQPHRDADTWNAVVDKALAGLPVTVTQSTSDEAKALRAHARDGLGAHHSPDLMHQQQDLHQATSLPLQTHVEAAQENEQQAEERALQACLDKVVWDKNHPDNKQRPDFEARIATAMTEYRQAQQTTQECRQRQEQTRQAIRGLGDDYHPFDCKSGAALSPEQLPSEESVRF